MLIAEPSGESCETSPRSIPWYQRAVIYELHVRAFHDGDKNGTGDFVGLIEKLDYIQDLGVTAIWLLPFCPSPWRDDGYDISDYVGIHPVYGQLDDFRDFLRECKRRNLRVITELVANHTSDEHRWFQRARHAPPASRWRDFYVWSDTPDKYRQARIIFKDFESSNWTWDPVAGAYYWHRFFSHQPDLNYASPDVRQAVKDAVDFWLGLGVDGLRLDAVPYLFEREGSTCENLPETHEFLQELRYFVDSQYEDRMLLAEANQWPEDAVEYFGEGNECHMAFNFPLMPRVFMALRMEDAFPIINIVRQTPTPPPGCEWTTFLRNHDELTLEMVCDEERDFMYRAYAEDPQMRINLGIRRRLAPLLGNDRRLIRLLNALLLSLPGTPVIYYGDEIGMGDDTSLGDRNGVRTPMQWTAGRNAGFSAADEASVYLPPIAEGEYSYQSVNVESNLQRRGSVLWWMRRALSARKDSDALTAGQIEFLTHRNRHVLAFLRSSDQEDVLVVANLSRYAQPVQIPLASFAGRIPVEAFGRVEFPAIAADPYQLSLEPYGFYWFVLRKPESEPPTNTATRPFSRFDWSNHADLADILKPHVRSAEVSRPRQITRIGLVETAVFSPSACLVFLNVMFSAGEPELQLLPLTIRPEADVSGTPDRIVAKLTDDKRDLRMLCIDAASGGMSNQLASLISSESEMQLASGTLRGLRLGPLPTVVPCENVCLLPNSTSDRQRNTSVLLSDVYVLKLFRRLEPGTSPEISTVRFLFEEASFNNVSPVLGKLTYTNASGESFDLGLLQAFVDSTTDLWQFTLDELSLYLDQAASSGDTEPPQVSEGYLRICRLLGRRTAEMHAALATAGPEHPEIAPEPFDAFALRGASYSMTTLAEFVRQTIESAPSENAGASPALEALETAKKLFSGLTRVSDPGVKIRTHGDLHLGQVLLTHDDVVFIDFEGDATRPLRERLIKTSPLADAASMLYSFRYAAVSTSFPDISGPFAWQGHPERLREHADSWYHAVSAGFGDTYFEHVAGRGLVPTSASDFHMLVRIYMVAKAVYQLAYELRNRPAWVPIAARTLQDIIAWSV